MPWDGKGPQQTYRVLQGKAAGMVGVSGCSTGGAGTPRTWEEQCTAPYMEVMGVKLTTCTSPWKWGLRTIWRAVAACTLSTLLLPRFSTLQPYSCAAGAADALCYQMVLGCSAGFTYALSTNADVL